MMKIQEIILIITTAMKIKIYIIRASGNLLEGHSYGMLYFLLIGQAVAWPALPVTCVW